MKQEENHTNEYLKGIVSNLPESPGIYQYLNGEGTIIYVGKAKNLKRRVSSYFKTTSSRNTSLAIMSCLKTTRPTLPFVLATNIFHEYSRHETSLKTALLTSDHIVTFHR